MNSRKRPALLEPTAVKILAASYERVEQMKIRLRGLAGAFLMSKNFTSVSNLYYDEKLYRDLHLRAGQLFIHMTYLDFVACLVDFIVVYPGEHRGKDLVDHLEETLSRYEIIHILLHDLDERNIPFVVDLWNYMQELLVLYETPYACQNSDVLRGAEAIVAKFGAKNISNLGLTIKCLRYIKYGFSNNVDTDSGVDTDSENEDLDGATPEHPTLNVLALKHILKEPSDHEKEMGDILDKLLGCFVVDRAPLTELPEKNTDNVSINNYVL